MNVLNLYACLGGNRLLWDNCNVTAIEIDPELARLYQIRFPSDLVIVADAHQYLLDHYKEFDFIWSSPPCPSHSRARFGNSLAKPLYPDLKLYEEIIFLENYFEGKFCVENVIPYYQPLIPAKIRGRHLYWTNFHLPFKLSSRNSPNMEDKEDMKRWEEFHQYDFTQYNGEQRRQKIARNLVDYEAGKTIFDVARGIIEKTKTNQINLEL